MFHNPIGLFFSILSSVILEGLALPLLSLMLKTAKEIFIPLKISFIILSIFIISLFSYLREKVQYIIFLSLVYFLIIFPKNVKSV